ncbi:MAG: MFS transporter [Candidatus Omnitrophica bacterium]|nr:MFS transporter [Candidatus Omnitrophota bacterium]
MKHPRLSILAWSLYDFANTIFAMNVVSYNFALWITDTHGTDDLAYSLALSISTAVVALAVPLLGAISDRYDRRMPYLRGYTLGCVLFTMLLGTVKHASTALIFFSIANACFQISNIFYNALIPQISTKGRMGRMSGIGTGTGYIGAIIGLIIVKPFKDVGGYQAAFIPTALCLLLFALPCLILIRDPSSGPARVTPRDFVRGWKKVSQTFRDARKYSSFFLLLLSSFLVLNAINTIIAFMSVYAQKVVGFTDENIFFFMIICTLFAVVASFVFGFVSDRLGALRTLKWTLGVWILAVVGGIFATTQAALWMIGPLVGIALAGTWVTSRVVVAELAPRRKTGEFFGLFGLAGRFSAILGPLVWGVTTWLFSSLGVMRYRIALGAMLVFILLGLRILRRVRMPEVENTR